MQIGKVGQSYLIATLTFQKSARLGFSNYLSNYLYNTHQVLHHLWAWPWYCKWTYHMNSNSSCITQAWNFYQSITIKSGLTEFYNWSFKSPALVSSSVSDINVQPYFFPSALMLLTLMCNHNFSPISPFYQCYCMSLSSFTHYTWKRQRYNILQLLEGICHLACQYVSITLRFPQIWCFFM